MSEKHSSLQQQFFAESGQILDQIESALVAGAVVDAAGGERLHCMAHGLHGAALTMGYVDFAGVARALERCLAQDDALASAATRAHVLSALAWLRQSLAALERGQALVEDGRAAQLCARLEGDQSAPQPAAERKLRLQFLVGRMLMGADVLLEQAWQILRERSTLCTVHEPQLKPAGTLWQADLLTAASDAQLRTALSHIADPGSLRIAPLAAETSSALVPAPASAPLAASDAEACLQAFRLGGDWFALPADCVCGALAVARKTLWALPAQTDVALVEWEGVLLPVFDPQPAPLAEEWLLLVLAGEGAGAASEALRIDELGALLQASAGRRLALATAGAEVGAVEAALQLPDGRRLWLAHAGWWRRQAAQQRPAASAGGDVASGDVAKMLHHLQRLLRTQGAFNAGAARAALHVEALQADLALAARQRTEDAAHAACRRTHQGLQALGAQLQALMDEATGFERNMQKWQQALQKIAQWQAIMTDSTFFPIDSVAESARMQDAENKSASVKTQGGRLLRQMLEKEWGALDS